MKIVQISSVTILARKTWSYYKKYNEKTQDTFFPHPKSQPPYLAASQVINRLHKRSKSAQLRWTQQELTWTKRSAARFFSSRSIRYTSSTKLHLLSDSMSGTKTLFSSYFNATVHSWNRCYGVLCRDRYGSWVVRDWQFHGSLTLHWASFGSPCRRLESDLY